MKKLFFVFLLSFPLFGGTLSLKSGSIATQAKMFMESGITPFNKELQADIDIQGKNIQTLSGSFFVDMNLFKSENESRDTDMYEMLDTQNYRLATYTIISVTPQDEKDMYTIHGKLNFHGAEQVLDSNAKIVFEGSTLKLEAKSSLDMPKYGIEMPCLMFICVEDKVALVIKAEFTK